MKTFLSVCTAGVVAGILTAAAATNGAPPRRDPGTPAASAEVNRVGKTDRLPGPKAGTIMVRTISISPAPRQEAARELTACEAVVSPLADRAASRRARQCAT
jgi:hypothetical protein